MSQLKLPQQDRSPKRTAELAAVRAEYGYDFTFVMPVGSQFHDRDKASTEWVVKLLKVLFLVRSNLEHVLKKTNWKFATEIPRKSPLELAGSLAKKDMKTLFSYYNPDLGPMLPSGRARDLADYGQMFEKIPKPALAADFSADKSFAHTFVAGANPCLLTRMTAPLPNFPLDQATYTQAPGFEQESLAEAIAEGRIYYVDYKELSTLVPGVHPQQKKYSFAPIIALGRPKNGRELLPIAIQCGQSPEGRMLFGPGDKWAWAIAKSLVCAAHYSHHELMTHLGFTHMLIEPIVLATRRQLHESHPVYALLSPHFEGTMPINFLAITKLIQPGEAVDRLVGSQKASNYDLIATQRLNYSFSGNFPPVRFKRQGADDATSLPLYPYRDDSLLIWEAVFSWAWSYVLIYYPSDALVAGDTELQAWAAEISSEAGGRVKDFGTDGRITDRAELADTLAMIIFTAGPQHAAVNFPQASSMSYLPAAPLAGYAEEPRSKTLTYEDWLNFLPPLDVAMVQVQTGTFLGSLHHTVLGQYESSHFQDPPTKAALAVFQARLAQIEDEIQRRNRDRPPYEHLLPSKIPQSINI